MPLIEIARFPDLQEAQIAKSALAACGIPSVIPDEMRASAVWTEQRAIGGIRLSVVGHDADTARGILANAEARARRFRSRRPAAPAGAPLSLATAPALLAVALFGWPLVGLRRRGPFQRVTAAVTIAITAAMFVLLVVLRRWSLAHAVHQAASRRRSAG